MLSLIKRELSAQSDTDSDGELVIDEAPPSERLIPPTSWKRMNADKVSHLQSISSLDMQFELCQDDANTCSICHETFKYNIGLIYHVQSTHLTEQREEEPQPKPKRKASNTTCKNKKKPAVTESSASRRRQLPMLKPLTLPSPTFEPSPRPKISPYECTGCRKQLRSKKTIEEHAVRCKGKVAPCFCCVYCGIQFCWESKYKKHLHRTHHLQAFAVCKHCSNVFADMEELRLHVEMCEKSVPADA